jgi:hypothetical protein
MVGEFFGFLGALKKAAIGPDDFDLALRRFNAGDEIPNHPAQASR